ncbi:ribonuclease G [Paracoccus aurantiacus]|uniref:Ribonuclease G n=1 Tax=Paracoccus aurantiacus TaxID=2599412 RepID=A0A5C6S3X3_9RHOB|nr:ribonuclease E/G [Paracoccus aurantiacus]TXB69310.1 ribonuclease G [Paracoccus aurantiacus]
MKGREILLGKVAGREAALLMVDGRLEDVAIDASDLVAFAPGAILRGRVNRLMKGQGGVFVTLPDGASGYLRDRSGLSEGQPVLVQVSGVAEDGKAVPLSSRVLIRGRYGIATPGVPGVNVSRAIRDADRRSELQDIGNAALGGAETGLILRSASVGAEDSDIAAELADLAAIANDIAADLDGAPELLLDAASPSETAWRDWAVPPPDVVTEHDILSPDAQDTLSALLSSRVPLPAGASAYIEQTRALVAIDVNTGSDGSAAAGLKANIALARDLPRQLRLRGLGGQVVVDFAPIPKRERGTLEQELKKAFRADGSDAVLSGWTAMGLFELSRKRDRMPINRLLEGL